MSTQGTKGTTLARPPRTPKAPEPQNFAEALRAARKNADNISGAQLEELIGLSSKGSRVSQWESGDPIAPEQVFAIELALDLPPGHLSHHLGYVPVGAPPSVQEAIDRDPTLDARSRQTMTNMYQIERDQSARNVRSKSAPTEDKRRDS